jgi:hypothetical protein
MAENLIWRQNTNALFWLENWVRECGTTRCKMLNCWKMDVTQINYGSANYTDVAQDSEMPVPRQRAAF